MSLEQLFSSLSLFRSLLQLSLDFRIAANTRLLAISRDIRWAVFKFLGGWLATSCLSLSTSFSSHFRFILIRRSMIKVKIIRLFTTYILENVGYSYHSIIVLTSTVAFQTRVSSLCSPLLLSSVPLHS